MRTGIRAAAGLFGVLLLPPVAEGAAGEAGSEPVTYRDFRLAPHSYFEREPTDRFSKLRASLEEGRVALDRTGEKAFLKSLLTALEIPETSQILVFSTTSLQLSRILPSNPRALYFSEDLYLGYIPGGRLELASVDRDLGPVFYIFDIPAGAEPIRVERATRCMNCHAGEDTGYVPGLVVKSVIPGPSGGSLDAFRVGRFGHDIPLEERFGGWYLTGYGGVTNHWGNAMGRSVDGVMTRIPVRPEERVPFDRYLRTTSNLLVQMIHEHQVGFVNRAVGATYRARTYLTADGGESRLTPEHRRDLMDQAEQLVRYLLFVDEAALPADGIPADAAFEAEFRKNRREAGGRSLKDLDLKDRLLRRRCSYMIYSASFEGLPAVVKAKVMARLNEILTTAPDERGKDKDYAKLSVEERRIIRSILAGTLSAWPFGS